MKEGVIPTARNVSAAADMLYNGWWFDTYGLEFFYANQGLLKPPQLKKALDNLDIILETPDM